MREEDIHGRVATTLACSSLSRNERVSRRLGRNGHRPRHGAYIGQAGGEFEFEDR